MQKYLNITIVLLLVSWIEIIPLFAQQDQDSIYYPKEDEYYTIQSLEIPQEIILEVSGLALMPNDQLAVSTRRGEVWILYNPYKRLNGKPEYKLFAQGLHEPLGIAYQNGALYVAQRQELTRLRDLDGDGRADEYKTIYTFDITGNYHEYAYGPVFDQDGNMIVTLNLGWINDQMSSIAKWRGWMVKITPEGELVPYAAGMRSPAGLTIDEGGDIYYSDNQGGWIGSGWVTEVRQGDFMGHPASLNWSDKPGSPVKLSVEDIPDTGKPMYEVAKMVPGIKSPTVWIPHAVLGVSTSDILVNDRNQMGPFKGQLFIGDQGQSMVNRIFLEEVKGVKQGVVFPFRSGFSSGVFRMKWGSDGSMFVGSTARGWGSTGGNLFGLQRLVWNGRVPFEMKAIRAMSDGFEVEFTKPVDKSTAKDVASYHIRSFTYKYHHKYGSPVIDNMSCQIKAIEVSDDQTKVRLVVDPIKLGYIHEISVPGIISEERSALLHSVGYYTVNILPSTSKLNISATNRVLTTDNDSLSNMDYSTSDVSSTSIESKYKSQSIDLEKHSTSSIARSEIDPLLARHTCQSCHHISDNRVGPSFREIAKRQYSKERLVELIITPEPGNWPEYATPMPPMSHIPRQDMEKIAQWIRTLD